MSENLRWRDVPAHSWLRSWGHWRHFRWSCPELKYASVHESGTGELPVVDESVALQVQKVIDYWLTLGAPRTIYIRQFRTHYVDAAFDGLSMRVQVARVGADPVVQAAYPKYNDMTFRRLMRRGVIAMGVALGVNDSTGQALQRR